MTAEHSLYDACYDGIEMGSRAVARTIAAKVAKDVLSIFNLMPLRDVRLL
jgi:hypothetical protein